jgi:homoserine dehydrogenase
MKTYNLALLGFGNVHRALVRLLEAKRPELRTRYGIEYRITGVATRRMGWLTRLKGMSTQALLESSIESTLTLGPMVMDINAWLKASEADVVFESTSLNAETGQPAIGYLKAALNYGAHAITANKGPVVHGYADLSELAASQGKRFFFESAVMDGAPIFSLFREALPATNLLRFRGILNSTSNFILGEVEAGSSFAEAVAKAQQMGIAETDPSADVEGWDAAVKVSALRTVLMGVPLKPQAVEREGIQNLTPEAIRAGRAAGRPYKLVCRADRQTASVKPEQVPLSDPLAGVNGTSSTVHFETDTLTGLTLTEHNPGPDTTAYGLLADFINAVKERV